MAVCKLDRFALICTLAAMFSAGPVAETRAENLLDMLFGGGIKRLDSTRAAPRKAPAPRQVKKRRAPAKIAKVAAPSFYTYKAAPLALIDFSPLSGSDTGVSVEENASPSPFKNAVAALEGYELSAEKDVGEAVIAFYTQRPAFVWISDGRVNERAQAVLQVLREAEEFGLSQADYRVSDPASEARMEPGDAVRFEMALSARALRYARDSWAGRVDPNKLSGYHDFPAKPIDLKQALAFLANASKPARYLLGLHPQNEPYRALVDELVTLQAETGREIVVDPKTFVRPGGEHQEFPKLLKLIERDAEPAFLTEHAALLSEFSGSTVYDKRLVPVIKAAQKSHGLNPDGVVGPRTVGAIAGDSRPARIEKVVAALERLRWHPSDLGDTRVIINAASFTVDFFEEGEPSLSMRTVVGKKANQTSFFYDKLEYVEFNPYWGVPRSILVNEMLPRLRRDPGYLDRTGYEVFSGGRRVSSSAVNWNAYGANLPFNVRQKPGRSNALGELKIMFPNRHAIYMHDTPSKSLFQRDTRAFSHGCVRLADPRAMAAAVLGTTRESVAKSIASGSGNPSRRNIERDIPVYVGYFTAWPEKDGEIGYFGDVYERDVYLKKAMDKVSDARAASS